MYSSYIYIAPWKLKKAVGEHGNSGFFWGLFLLLRSRPLLFFMECIEKPFIFFLPVWIMAKRDHGVQPIRTIYNLQNISLAYHSQGNKELVASLLDYQINLLLTIDLCCWAPCPGLKHEPLIFF
ncbi:hypothetical protein POTOM_056477 [Populus tomentosa]|uniref:Uncharacterized protein n=1 Tax=Populus tomentosa TaxID=118781 RepID=A0A8X7Y156_POPTO|nr:hypothetical protein POTOM_056477 [Populus tomentosa]